VSIRNLPPLHSLRAFEAAARHLNFEAAADELHLDPSAISHQIRKLEAILGITLFRRRPRPLSLTESGARLYPEIRAALDRMSAAVTDVSATRIRSGLTISMSMAFAAEWFTPRLPKLQACTGLDIAVDADNRPADLNIGDVDIAIRSQQDAGPSDVWQPLFDDRMIAVAAPELLARSKVPFDPNDLSTVPLIRYRWTNRSRSKLGWEAWFAASGVARNDLSFAATFSEESHAISAAVAGQGAALLSERLVAERIAAGELRRIGTTFLPAPPYWVVHRDDHPRADDLHLLVDCINHLNDAA
jgi:LysR family glycine cleavage system transcriptional activator|tara:strand:+ start:254 stop:1156 length:903 start_codon:yes stop_codon:yes gene_type:complete